MHACTCTFVKSSLKENIWDTRRENIDSFPAVTYQKIEIFFRIHFKCYIDMHGRNSYFNVIKQNG